MKRVSLIAVILVFLFAVAYAHDGAISLYTDETLTDCDMDLGIFQPATIYIMYVRDNGPMLGKAAQFKLLPSTSDLNLTNEEWSPDIVLTIGSVATGISITGSGCLGSYSDNVYLGKVDYLNLGDPDTFTVRVVDDPGAVPTPGIFITLCEEGDPIYRVIGGTFVFNGTCNPATETKSWGAIKSMYR